MSVHDHFDDIEKEENKKVEKSANKERKYYVIIAAMGIIFAAYEILKNI